MKVALLTHHWVANFGANLQAFSTFSFLKKRGHDVEILNYRPQKLEGEYRELILPGQMELHEQFCAAYLNQSPLLRSEAEIVDYCQGSGYDAIIVGSDTVFRIDRHPRGEETRFPNPFWLGWAKESLRPSPRIGALAATAAGSPYFLLPPRTRRGVGRALKVMDCVTVRDRWTKRMVQVATERTCDPAICPDPVCVLDEKMSSSNGSFDAPIPRRYVIISTVPGTFSDDWVRDFVKIMHDKGLEAVSLPFPSKELTLPVDRVIPLPLPPLEWYRWIKNAAGFLGTRFHSLACSIFNNVPFVSLDTNSKVYLRLFPIRLTSKQYDLSMNVQGCSRCVLLSRARRLKPQAVVQMLEMQQPGYADSYAQCARQAFERSVAAILGTNDGHSHELRGAALSTRGFTLD